MSVIVCTLAEVTGLSPATIRTLAPNRPTRMNLAQLTALLDVLTDLAIDIGDLLYNRHHAGAGPATRRPCCAGRISASAGLSFDMQVGPRCRASAPVPRTGR